MLCNFCILVMYIMWCSATSVYCSLKGPQTTCCSSVPEVVSEVLDLLPSTSSPLSAGETSRYGLFQKAPIEGFRSL